MKHYLFAAQSKALRCCGAVLVVILCSLSTIFALPGATASADAQKAYVRVIHASPFVGTADVFVDGKALLSSFQFGAVTDYVEIPQGVHKVQIALVGKGIDASVINQDLTVNPGAYTVAALGATPTSLSLQVFVDNNQLAANRTRVRIYHLSPDAGTVNVALGEDDKLNGVSYPTASDYVTMDAGPCTFSVTDPQLNMTRALPTQLTANSVTSIFAVGLFSGAPNIELISAKTAGVPGLPQTGSVPTIADSAQPLSPWFLVLIAVALIGIGTAARRFKRAA